MAEETMNQNVEEEVIDSAEDTAEVEEAESSSDVVEDNVDNADAAEVETEEAEGETKEKRSFFSKKKKDKKDEQIEELTDKLKRSIAEFDNFRKRTEKEKASMYMIGAKEIIEKILPVVDNFERGLAQAKEDDPFAEGMKMIYKLLMTTLEDMGVKPIEAVGCEFNPDFHNAVMHIEDENFGENIVAEEFQKGYTYKDFVVRHSMVKVAN